MNKPTQFPKKAYSYKDVSKEEIGELSTIRFSRNALSVQKRWMDNKEEIPKADNYALVFDSDSGICVGGIAYNDRIVYAFTMIQGLLSRIRNIKDLKW